MQPIAIACQPGTSRADYFVVASGTGGPRTVFWLGTPGPPQPGQLANWFDLGGEALSIDAEWSGDGSVLYLLCLGQDDRLWSNSLSALTNEWTGWVSDLDSGVLHNIVVTTS